MNLEISGVLSFLVLVLDIWAIVKIVNSSASTFSKVIWVVAILVLPFIGFIIWLIFGPK